MTSILGFTSSLSDPITTTADSTHLESPVPKSTKRVIDISDDSDTSDDDEKNFPGTKATLYESKGTTFF